MLQRLRLSYDIYQMVDVQILDLGGKRLVKFPKDLSAFSELVELFLDVNKLTHIPLCVKGLQKLRFINLRENKLREFPVFLYNLPCLEVVVLSKNELTELPQSIECMQGLKELYLQGNLIEQGVIENLKELLPNCKIYKDYE